MPVIFLRGFLYFRIKIRPNKISMSIYFFLRYVLISILLVGWVFYQAVIKKRKWADLKGDAFAVLFFALVWIGIAYFFTH